MPREKAQFVIKGMSRDLADSNFNPQYAFENHNIRITPTEHSTLLVLSNEKGNAVLEPRIRFYYPGESGPEYSETIEYNGYTYDTLVSRYLLGYTVLHKTIILFQKLILQREDSSETVTFDAISKLEWINEENPSTDSDKYWQETILYHEAENKYSDAALGFREEFPIEALSLYESYDVQKVYWVDGIHQPRVINIYVDADHIIKPNYSTQFDFVPTLELREEVTITRRDSPTGRFPAGTLQYAFTYSRKNGQESKLFWISNLHYTVFGEPENRAGAPDELTPGSYEIRINWNTVDAGFDYINIYSIIRSSEDGGLQAKLVTSLNIDNREEDYVFIDTNNTGETIASTDLLFTAGDEFVAETMATKDNTLFLGNIETKEDFVSEEIKEAAKDLEVDFVYDAQIEDWEESSGFYWYKNPLFENRVTYLKAGNKYRIGLQLQDNKGTWSEPLFVKDVTVTERPKIEDGDLMLPIPRIQITTAFLNKLNGYHYKRIRPIIVYPEVYERGVVAQGIVCSTVFLKEDRLNNSPFAQSSWFFRPYQEDGYGDYGDNHKGLSLEARHAHCLPEANTYNAEVQNTRFEGYATSVTPSQDYFVDGSILTFHSPEVNDTLTYADLQNTDLRIVGILAIDAVNGKSKILATAPLITTTDCGVVKNSDVDRAIGATSTFPEFCSQTLWKQTSISSTQGDYYMTYPFHKKGLWQNISEGDTGYGTGDIVTKTISNIRFSQEFIFYPQSEIGSYNEEHKIVNEEKIFRAENGDSLYTLNPPDNFTLNFSSLYYRGNMSKPIISSNEYPIYKSNTFNGTIVKGSSSEDSSQDPIYVNYRSTDHIVITLKDNGSGHGAELPLPKFANDPDGSKTGDHFYEDVFWLDGSEGGGGGSMNIQFLYASDIIVLDSDCNNPENIDYYPDATDDPDRFVVRATGQSVPNSTRQTYPFSITVWKFDRHLYDTLGPDPTPEDIEPCWISSQFEDLESNILNIAASRHQVMLPPIDDYIPDDTMYMELNSEDGHAWTLTGSVPYNDVRKDLPDGFDPDGREIMWITEIIREIPDNIFGGESDYAIKSNKWLPCGESVIIPSPHTAFNVNITEGDVIFNRWDCLKTLPYSKEDTNQITEILSFMCESYVNTAGRYDKERGKQDYTLIDAATPFNQMNPAYNNRNDFFTYRISNLEKEKDTDFPNVVVWSMTKTLGEEIDTWTHILLSSSMSLDGDKGEIRALRRWKNEIFSFQDTGISQIIFNPSTAIATTTGIPVEIANSNRVEGKRYISENIGCTNKWSICITQSGLYFVDPTSKRIYAWTEKGIDNLSEGKGFTSWLNTQITEVVSDKPGDKYGRWSPVNWKSSDFITLYDKNMGDVYFISPEYCLTFNEGLAEFTSFYDYNNTPFMINMDERCLAFNSGKLWEQHAGSYNLFFDDSLDPEYSPYWVEVVANPKPTEDKIFDNIEFRADSWTLAPNDTEDASAGYHEVLSEDTFDWLETWNEYQSGAWELDRLKGYPSSLKKKFRVWYANIPRDRTIKRDRMRNTWLHLRLEKKHPLDERTVLHDLQVKYFI